VGVTNNVKLICHREHHYRHQWLSNTEWSNSMRWS